MNYLPKILTVIGILFILITPPKTPSAAPTILNITDNRNSYPNQHIPLYEKLEINFDINTVATNPHLPFDSNPVSGVVLGNNGITINGLFTSPAGKTYSQPAFYYQEFDDKIKPDSYGANKEWFYATGKFYWKLRFSPHEIGTWNYYITAQDSSGSKQSSPLTFVVTNNPDSNKHGFIKVSPKDPRYFEFDDGSYFPGLGYNELVSWVNPVLDNQENFEIMQQNGIQLIRMWLSQWAIYGSAWNPWYGIKNDYDGYVPRTGLITNGLKNSNGQVYDPLETPSSVMTLVYAEDANGNKNSGSWFDACRFMGGWGMQPAVKNNTKYHISIRYKAAGISGPRNPSYQDYGFVIKIQNPNDGNWHQNCFEPGEPTTGVRISHSYGHDSASWTTLEGEWNSNNNNYFPLMYLALENVNSVTPTVNGQPYNDHPYLFISDICIAEDPNNSGKCDPPKNIVLKPSPEHLKYFMQRNSYAFDKALELAHQHNVYLRVVTSEKNEVIANEIDYQGQKAGAASNDYFYGNYRNMTPIRWYQKSWWRYLQARWGYSANIHTWELVNEGDPNNNNHYALADELGKYMHCAVFNESIAAGDGQKCTYNHPNDHLVSTSTWNSFPKDTFWANSKFPNVDFADYHQYVSKETDLAHFKDTASMTYDISYWLGAKQNGGAHKPIIRGETGLTDSGTEPGTQDLLPDQSGIWLHKFLWGQLNSGGLIESYWYSNYEPYGHIYAKTSNPPFDHRNEFGHFYGFINDLSLNNGYWQDLGASVSNDNLIVIGQKEVANGFANKAYLWVNNKDHTWWNTINQPQLIIPRTGEITITGFSPNQALELETWDTYAGVIINSSTVNSNNAGLIKLNVNNLKTDTAFKIIGNTPTQPASTPTYLPNISSTP
jgi:hypothetical protein